MSIGNAKDMDALATVLSVRTTHLQEGDYAELLDEDDEQGVVCIRRKNGTMIAQMPREIWDELRTRDLKYDALSSDVKAALEEQPAEEPSR